MKSSSSFVKRALYPKQRHVAMVAKFLDDNKPKKSLKSLSALFQTYPSYSISFNLANLGEIFFGNDSIVI